MNSHPPKTTSGALVKAIRDTVKHPHDKVYAQLDKACGIYENFNGMRRHPLIEAAKCGNFFAIEWFFSRTQHLTSVAPRIDFVDEQHLTISSLEAIVKKRCFK